MKLIELWKVTKADIKMDLTINNKEIPHFTKASTVRDLEVNRIDYKDNIMIVDLKEGK